MVMVRFAMVGVSLMALSGFSWSADFGPRVQNGDDTQFFGNIHISAIENQVTPGGGSSVTFPAINIGGTFSIEPIESNIGLQFDFGGDGYSETWIRPTIPAEGTNTDAMAVIHGTYIVNDDIKVGVFGGTEGINQNLTKITSPTFTFLGQTNLASASNKLKIASFGAEALYSLSPETWIQARAGLVRPMSATTSFTDATTALTTTTSFDLSQDRGYEFGLGYRTGFGSNFSVRADANFISILPSAGGYANRFNTLLTGQYIFDSMPLAAMAQVGYQKETYNSGNNYDDISVSTGLSWSFGGVTDSVRGKLFRSAGYGGDFN
jgi:hypothetical protein